ncbi:MAG: DUF4258 domain-containing protein [Chlamydiales bacterium]
MGKVVKMPNPKTRRRSLDEWAVIAHEVSKKSENVYWDSPHVQLRMRERKVTIRQIFDVLRHGKGIDGPTLDRYGDWRIKLKRFSAGRVVQVVVVIQESRLEIVTVI